MSRRCSNVTRIGPPDSVLVRYAGSNAATSSVSYISVLIVGSLKDTRSGFLTGTEFARFVLLLESNSLISLTKIIFGVHYTINEDAVFRSSVVKSSTVVSSLSAIRTSLRTVLRTLSPAEISSCIPGENIRL